ncbi:MAG: serpin family protein [Calditrichaeota bacterium]|nr:serpin family protein [Calditrichota bacterium]
MSHFKWVLLLVGFAFLWGGCSKDVSPLQPVGTHTLTPLEKKVVSSSNDFGFNLFKEIVREDSSENIFVSPLSVSMALGMTLNGANGETERAMKTTLGFGDMDLKSVDTAYRSLITYLLQADPKVIFELANSIWYRNTFPFEKSFFDVVRTYFQSEVQGLNFNDPNSVKIINNWVAAKTHNKIKSILDRIDKSSVMFLINAIYFKGTWTYQFKKEATQEDSFYLPDGSTISVQMMNQSGEYDYFETDQFQAIDLPYGDGAYSMTIFLPTHNVPLDSLIGQLNPQTWHTWMGRFEKKKGGILLPKFTLRYKINLNSVLEALGMGIAFSPSQADFTRMSKKGGLYIGFVKHKTFAKVDEEGTEAAAVTVVGMYATSVGGGSNGFTMIVNRPFLCVIREHATNTIVFIGKISHPQWED